MALISIQIVIQNPMISLLGCHGSNAMAGIMLVDVFQRDGRHGMGLGEDEWRFVWVARSD